MRYPFMNLALVPGLASLTLSSVVPDGPTPQQTAPQSEEAALRVPIEYAGASLTLELQPHSVLAPETTLDVDVGGTLVAVPVPAVPTYRGRIQEIPGSIVAATLVGEELEATIRMPNGKPLVVREEHSDGHARLVLQEPSDPSNPTSVREGRELEPLATYAMGGIDPSSHSSTLALEHPIVCKIAFDADYEFFETFGTVEDTCAAIHSFVNQMSIPYEDLGITYAITKIVVRTSPDDPYEGQSPRPHAQMDLEWTTTYPQVDRDVAFLMTGRSGFEDESGRRVFGQARRSSIRCEETDPFEGDASDAYGWVEYRGSFLTSWTLAHELGHTWGRPHCRDCSLPSPSPCCNTQIQTCCTVYNCKIMCSSHGCLECIDEFAFSSNMALGIINYALNRPCLRGELESFQVVSKTLAPGTNADLEAVGYYRNHHGQLQAWDHTEDVDLWESENPTVGSFADSASPTVTANQVGLTPVRATLWSRPSDNPALLVVTDDDAPKILYAGWADSHVEAGVPSTLRIEARVSDLNDDVASVHVQTDEAPYLLLNDAGTTGDRYAGDGIYSWQGSHTLVFPDACASETNPGCPAPSSLFCDRYFEIVAEDSSYEEAVWPYLRIGSGSGALPVPGFGTMPYCSEKDGPGPYLHGIGFGLSELEPNVAGDVTLIAYAPPSALVDMVKVYALGGPQPLTTLVEPGTGFLDGLYFGELEVENVEGDYVLDFVPLNMGPLRIGDAYPRLRFHNPSPCGTPDCNCACD